MKTLKINVYYENSKHEIEEEFTENEYLALSNEKLLRLTVCGILYAHSWIPDSIKYSYYWK